MTATSPDVLPSLPSPPEDQAEPTQPSMRQKLKLSAWNSLGTKLFLSVLAGAVLGLGGMGVFIYQYLESQGRTQIADNLNGQVQGFDSQLRSGEQFAISLAAATRFLYDSKIQSPAVYKNMVNSFMAAKPKLVQGFGIMQTPGGLVPDRTWFAPYIYEQAEDKLRPTEEKLPPPNQAFLYGDLAFTDDYSRQDYYLDTLKEGKNFWLEPYTGETYPVTLTSFQGPIKNDQGKVIALLAVDIKLKDLVNSLVGLPVFQKAGYFALVTPEGNLLAYPPDPNKAEKLANIKQVPQLQQVWQQVQQGLSQENKGLIADGTSYLAYERIPSTNWIMLASVPRQAVTGPAILVTTGGVLAVGVVLAGVVILFVRRLNKRLEPILEECDKLAETDAETQVLMSKQDELGRLSTSFFNVLSQLVAKEEQMRQEVALTTLTEERLRTATEAQAESELLQTDLHQLLEMVSSLQEGDLTVQAQVSDRPTGLVADTLNLLTEELAKIMSTVVDTTQQVTLSAEDLERMAADVSGQAQQQAQSVSEMQRLLANVNRLSQNSARQAEMSGLAVEQAQVAVAQGQKGMGMMTAGITELQQGTEQIVRRVGSLTDFVDMANQFAKDQKRVAALTRVLALNASMIAARASGQQDPEQFASVAKEFSTIAGQVNDLAVQANQGLLMLQQRTDQIQTAVSGISQDALGFDDLVNRFTTTVEASRQAFENIKAATEEVAQVGQQISQANQAIASSAHTTLTSIEDIAAAAAVTEGQSRLTRDQAVSMGQLAKNLLQRVQFFHLPAQAVKVNPVMALPPQQGIAQLPSPPAELDSTQTNGHSPETEAVDQILA